MINPTSLPGVHIQNDGMQCTAAQLFLRSDRLRHGHSASDTGARDRKHPIAREKHPQMSVTHRFGTRGPSCKQNCHAQVTDYCRRVGGLRKQTTDGMARGVAL